MILHQSHGKVGGSHGQCQKLLLLCFELFDCNFGDLPQPREGTSPFICALHNLSRSSPHNKSWRFGGGSLLQSKSASKRQESRSRMGFLKGSAIREGGAYKTDHDVSPHRANRTAKLFLKIFDWGRDVQRTLAISQER